MKLQAKNIGMDVTVFNLEKSLQILYNAASF